MNKYKLFIYVLVMIMLCVSCTSTMDNLYDEMISTQSKDISQQSSDISQKGEDISQQSVLSGDLYIVDMYSYFISALVEGFMKEHPGVNIICEYANQDELMTLTGNINFTERIRVQLMSRENTPDIINIAYILNVVKAADNGLIIDLLPYWNNDQDIIPENYFINILELYTYNNGLYAIPSTFSSSFYYLNKRVPESIGINFDSLREISAMEILDIYLEALDEGFIDNEFWLMYGDSGKNSILGIVLSEFICMKDRVAYFNTPEFIEYLEKTNQIPTNVTVFNSGFRNVDTRKFEMDNNSFMLIEGGSFAHHGYRFNETPDTTAAVLITASDGGAIINTNMLYVITSSCSYPELAWEFIKYCILESEEAPANINRGDFNGDRFSGFWPINKINFSNHLESWMRDSFSEDILNQFLRYVEQLTYANPDPGFELGFLDILSMYYDYGLITAEEAARQMQERAEIYFSE